jgi:hypothetical protein
MSIENIKKQIVKVHTSTGQGLGVITFPFVLTCASLAEGWSTDIGRDGCVLNVEKVWNGESIELCVYSVDCGFNFMTLGEDPIDLETDDSGKRSLFLEASDDDVLPITPYIFDFTSSDSNQFDGYFFLADGKTKHNVSFYLNKSDFKVFIPISLDVNTNGCAGGPLFTSDNKLVGILKGVYVINNKKIVSAVRIDLVAARSLLNKMKSIETMKL